MTLCPFVTTQSSRRAYLEARSYFRSAPVYCRSTNSRLCQHLLLQYSERRMLESDMLGQQVTGVSGSIHPTHFFFPACLHCFQDNKAEQTSQALRLQSLKARQSSRLAAQLSETSGQTHYVSSLSNNNGLDRNLFFPHSSAQPWLRAGLSALVPDSKTNVVFVSVAARRALNKNGHYIEGSVPVC